MSFQSRTDIVSLLDAHGVSPAHRLGQHFLADPNIVRKIVALSEVRPGDMVVEVGAGTGALTLALADAGARVVSYEVDLGLRPLLDDVTRGHDVELRFENATKVDLGAVLTGGPWVMVANLPYNVGTSVLMEALRHAPQIRRFVVMVQREVGERLAASAGEAEYGIPSVTAQIHSDVRVAFRVPAQVFYPQPNVESVVVTLDRKPAAKHSERAIELAKVAFGQRRKMLRRSLSGLLSDPEGELRAAGIGPERRAEDLSPSDYLHLAGAGCG